MCSDERHQDLDNLYNLIPKIEVIDEPLLYPCHVKTLTVNAMWKMAPLYHNEYKELSEWRVTQKRFTRAFFSRGQSLGALSTTAAECSGPFQGHLSEEPASLKLFLAHLPLYFPAYQLLSPNQVPKFLLYFFFLFPFFTCLLFMCVYMCVFACVWITHVWMGMHMGACSCQSSLINFPPHTLSQGPLIKPRTCQHDYSP